MKKIYEKPEVMVVELQNEDIITVSGGLVKSKFTIDSGSNTISY